MGLSLDQEKLLARMRSDNDAAGYPFTPHGWWEKVSDQFEGWFDDHGLDNLEPYNRHFAGLGGQAALARHIQCLGGDLTEYHKLERYTVNLLYAAIWKRYQRPLHYGYGTAMDWDVLTAQEALFAINEVNPKLLSEQVLVADLGAGWGRIGFALMKMNPRAVYIIFDIPDSLIVSCTYLNQYFPSLCRPYGMHPRYPYEPGIYFLGSQELANCDTLDFLITIATTQEMEPAHARAYLNLIERKAEWFYTLQRHQTGVHYKNSWKCHFNRSPLWADYHFEALFEL